MATDGEQKPIDRVFAELKAKGLVAARRKLAPKKAKWSGNFKAGIFRPRNIYYNERYSSLDDNLLRFALLHEEGHHTSKQTWKLLVGFVVAGFAFLIYFYLVGWYSGHPDANSLNFATVVMAFLSLMSLRAFETPLQEDETRADLHAARTLIEKVGVENPSVVAMSLLRSLEDMQPDKTSLSYRLKHFIGGGIHPSDMKRVKAIQELEESMVIEADSDGDPGH